MDTVYTALVFPLLLLIGQALVAVGWVETWGAVFFQVNSAQTDGTNQGSLSYPIF